MTMAQLPYEPLLERVLAFVAEERFASELKSARAAFVRATGETFEEDHSFEARAHAFLDWFVFDRPLEAYGDVPVRAYASTPGGEDDAETLRVFSRSVHGVFVASKVRSRGVVVTNVLTAADYDVPERIDGLRQGDLFETRLVPWQGRLCFSRAFIFHPREMLPALRKALARARRDRQQPAVQELTWTMARMASRAEHYPKMAVETVYDFERPPPMIERLTPPRASSLPE